MIVVSCNICRIYRMYNARVKEFDLPNLQIDMANEIVTTNFPEILLMPKQSSFSSSSSSLSSMQLPVIKSGLAILSQYRGLTLSKLSQNKGKSLVNYAASSEERQLNIARPVYLRVERGCHFNENYFCHN